MVARRAHNPEVGGSSPPSATILSDQNRYCLLYTSDAADAAERYGMKGNLVAGANIAGFEKIASAMMSQGIV